MGFGKEKIRQVTHLMLLAAFLVLVLIYSEEVFQGIGFLFSILSPFVVGGVIAFVLNIPMRAIEEKLFAFWKGRSAGRLKRAVSLVLAVVLNFHIFFCIGLLAYWLTDVDKLFGTVSIVITVISGGIFPLDIFGGTVEFLVNLLPFGYTTQFPVNIINGRFGWGRVGGGMAVQCAWSLAFVCLGGQLWKRGSRRYMAVGG